MRGIESIEKLVTRRSASVGQRLQERDQSRPLPQAGDLLRGGFLHLADEIRLTEHGFDDARSLLLIGRIGEERLDARASLDRDVDSASRQAADRVGDEGDAPFTGSGLFRHPHQHRGARV
jgi:hypothetical protein